MELPHLPAPIGEFLPYFASQSNVATALGPYKEHESKLRQLFAQHPTEPVLNDHHVNTVPLYAGHQESLQIRSRQVAEESPGQKEKYLLALSDKDRRANGTSAIVGSLKEFRSNFNLFCESSLVDLDWTNVVAAGSSVVTSLLPVPAPYGESKRAQRTYYHEKLAPASDIDLFMYGLDETGALEKIKQLETRIRDSILGETTTIRTKYAITIASQYPTRHIQIVLRLYKSVSEILTGFDVDCSCVAFDGTQVWAVPRAIAAFATQMNTIDLSRRSPSYENRLSKYARRGFEAHWPALDRSRIDPTIFERSFARVQGLARLLVFEKLPGPYDRESYLIKRRQERGRPPSSTSIYQRELVGNKKDSQPEDIAEWVEEGEVSNYHTFTVPYGPRYSARRIERLLFTKDLLLNAEWNRPKERDTDLHRHPAFLGSVDDIIHDCCGFCPKPQSDEDKMIAEEEAKTFISGAISFLKDDPGRQEIGSFHPITDTDWTEMAYVGNTERLCQAIIDGDLEHVEDWCAQEGVDVNRRDYTGRTPLQLAAQSSTLAIVQCLINNGARLVARMVDGFTALHIAAQRGDADIVRAILEKSEANEEEEAAKEDERRKARGGDKLEEKGDQESENESEDGEDSEEEDEEDEDDAELVEDSASGSSDPMTEGSFVKLTDRKNKDGTDPENDQGPDFYDINLIAWDYPVSPLHLAISQSHLDVIDLLVSEFGADVMLPVKIVNSYDRSPQAAIFALALTLTLATPEASKTAKKLLALGASSTQADMDGVSAFHFVANSGRTEVLDMIMDVDGPAAKRAVNHACIMGWRYNADAITPLKSAVTIGQLSMAEKLLTLGASHTIPTDEYIRAYQHKFDSASEDSVAVKKNFELNTEQPIVEAVAHEMPKFVQKLIQHGADVNTIPKAGQSKIHHSYSWQGECVSVLDLVRQKIKKLEESKEKSTTKLEAPASLKADDFYLRGLVKDTYRYWLAENDLAQARSLSELQLEWHADSVKKPIAKGTAERDEAMKNMIADFKTLEKDMLRKGAKTFQQLYPDKYEEQKDDAKKGKTEPYNTSYKFLIPDSSQVKVDGYLKLFQAAWDGDLATIKALTLETWGESQKPLQIAVQDSHGFSPFSIAVLRGHLQVATSVLEIIGMQYQPKDEDERKRYRLWSRADEDDYGYFDDSDYESDRNDRDRVRVVSEIADKKYTSEDVTQLADTIKSRIKPFQVLTWFAEFWRFLGDPKEDIYVRKESMPHDLITDPYAPNVSKTSWQYFHAMNDKEVDRARCSFVRYAIAKNDLQLLKFLEKIQNDVARKEMLAKKGPDSDSRDGRLFTCSVYDSELAMRYGRIDMIGYLISTTGANIPLEKLIERSGVLVTQKPKYYQGLSVHGKKRQDWADQSRGVNSTRPGDGTPPLLAAARQGNVDSIEYFMGDAPLRRFKDFAATNDDNELIMSLAESEGGIAQSFATWLQTRSNLAIHMAVMSEPRKEDKDLALEHLLQKMPENINVKCVTGETPLQVAFQLNRLYAAKTLIVAGANQATRNQRGENLLHSILDVNHDDPELLRAALNLLDQFQIPGMLLERYKDDKDGLLTPLAAWIRRTRINLEKAPAIFQLLQTYSQGTDLEIMDGAGDYPLNHLLRTDKHAIIEAIISTNPSLLYKENAAGMTPIDIAEHHFLHDLIQNPPSITSRAGTYASITHAPPSDFLPENAGRKNLKPSPAVHNLHLIRAAAARYPGKRQLVGLSDANEVARRLARDQKEKNEKLMLVDAEAERRRGGNRIGYGVGSGEDGGEEEKKTDEVDKYRQTAREFRKFDLELFEKEVLGREAGLDGRRKGGDGSDEDVSEEDYSDY